MEKTVLVIGDLVYDNNLVRLPGTHLSYSELLPSAVLSGRPGNAWYQAELVEKACADLDASADKKVKIVGPDEDAGSPGSDNSQIAQAYSLWSQFDRQTGSRDKVWRVERFLGCHKPSKGRMPVSSLAEQSPDLILIDDENLGFRDNKELWSGLVDQLGDSTQVLLKAAVPLGKGDLWDTLFEKQADRLTVVLSVNRLRTQYAAISEALSWDLAIEELDREFKEGHLAPELQAAAQVIVYFSGAGAASYEKGHLERFVYHPEELEGVWYARRPGHTFGGLSIISAAVARHMLEPETYPLFVALGRAISAIRQSHDIGAGLVAGSKTVEMVDSFKPEIITRRIEEILHPPEDVEDADLPECEFRAAFPKSRLTGNDSDDDGEIRSDLLQDLTGPGYEYVAARAMQVVMEGPEKALGSTPKARYGKYLTADREEIERINEIRSLILSYSATESDRTPLSIAVFGPPGSGKSFAIKQLAEELFGKGPASLEFNLSQFRSEAELHQAFHQVRDASLKGSIPLVFWDEFDSGNLKWLKEFLAPMQDAEFREGGISHPFSKAIFVFAGGIYPDFQSFDRSTEPETDEEFRAVKGPDFVSRLRGYVNIKGPNSRLTDIVELPAKAGVDAGEPPDKAPEHDVAHIIRRAILLRSVIQRRCPHLIDSTSGRASVSSSVARAFLRVKLFRHGARSLEAIVNMSSLAERDFFGVAELPSPRLLHLHVTPDFMEHVRYGEMESETIELIARERHIEYLKKRSPHKSYEELLKEWMDLSEEKKDLDRVPARATLAMLQEIGCDIVPMKVGEKKNIGPLELSYPELESLMHIEHEMWLRNRLIEGYERAEVTDKRLHLNSDAVRFDKLPPEEQELNRAIVAIIPDALWRGGYKLEKRDRNDA